jgi:protein-tyrosine phosphatase
VRASAGSRPHRANLARRGARNLYTRTMSELPHILNLRDLGGVPVEGGQRVRHGRLYRSASIDDVTPKEKRTLVRDLGVGAIIDLRSGLGRTGDPYVPGALQVHVPLVPMRKTMELTFEDGNLRQFLRGKWRPDTYDVCGIYRRMVDPQMAPRWRQIFRVLIESDGCAVLWHCTNGKDRTGLVAAVILKALGARDADIRADYLQSNWQLAAHRTALLVDAAQTGKKPRVPQMLGPLLEARPEFLNAAFDAIDEHYGSFDGFMEDAVGFSIAEDDLLHGLFLE